MEELHVIVSGRVQRVMFRDFVKRGARRLGLAGWVKNLPDGTVEVLAQGKHVELERLLHRIERGSILSEVRHVDARWQEASSLSQGFEIIY